MVSNLVSEANLSWYRQDFNTLPSAFWRAKDAASSASLSTGQQQTIMRGGITESLHIEGLYRFWDDLVALHPGLSIDNCASGK